MPGIHKNKTVAFRPSKCERIMIEEKALLSGLTKKDFIKGAVSIQRFVLSAVWRISGTFLMP